jgi:GMP synthase (glutamine-hydrolysing)
MSEIDVQTFVKKQVESIRATLGNEKALIAVSGGVDSSVCAVLTYKAIGDNLICVFIDDNFMRLGEPKQVKEILSSPPLNLPVKILNEKKRFMNALAGLTDAEEKRKAFRKTFYETLSDAAKDEGCRFLVQGTIKADIEETKGGIKTQHNILEQIGINPVNRFGFKIIEPIKTLYKYQVRAVARFLGTPNEISERQPFPGPGLSVRVVGEITDEKIEQIKYATEIVEDVFKEEKPSQYFNAIINGKDFEAPLELRNLVSNAINLQNAFNLKVLDGKATGMLEGERTYGKMVAIEVVDNNEPVKLDYDTFGIVRMKIQSAFPEYSRVLYLISSRDLDDGYYISMRAVETKDFLTAEISKIPWVKLKIAAEKILNKCSKVMKVYYDLTPKPPATVEFE